MQTTLFNTDFWKQDKIFLLTPDVRNFYLCLLTNPERNITRAFKCSDRLMSAYTGYTKDIIDLCREKLISIGLIEYISEHYILAEQNYIKPTKGKLSDTIYEKSFQKLPQEVKELLRSGSGAAQEPLRSRSGAAPEYNNKDNNKDKDKDKEEKYPFEDFWKIYPNNSKKPKCKEYWKKMSEEERKKVIEDIPKRLLGEKWSKKGGQFIEMSSTYLNNKMWEDNIIKPKWMENDHTNIK